MDFKNAIFDLDGTLLDSMYYWRHIAFEFLNRIGISDIPEALKQKAVYMYTRQALLFIKQELNIEAEFKFTPQEGFALMKPHYISGIVPKENAVEFLKKLKNDGIKTCLATATDRDTFMPALERLGMTGLFDGIVTTLEVGKSKNHPDVFDKALSMLGGTKENTVIFEDASYSIRTAVENGYRVWAIEDEYERDHKDEIIALSERYIKNYNEII